MGEQPPTAVWTNGIGNKTASHLNFTRTLADKPKSPKRKLHWRPEPGKTPYAGFDDTERKWR